MMRNIAIETIRCLFILLFTYAAVTKLMEYDTFVVQIGKSPLLTGFADIVAWLVPAVALVTALMLAVKRLQIIGLYAAFGLMVLFTVYITAILQFSEDIPCSCGGVLDSLGWGEHLAFNIVFALLGLAGIFLSNASSPPKTPTNTQGMNEHMAI